MASAMRITRAIATVSNTVGRRSLSVLSTWTDAAPQTSVTHTQAQLLAARDEMVFPRPAAEGQTRQRTLIRAGSSPHSQDGARWALAGLGITARGEVTRNASQRDIIELAERSEIRLTRGKAVIDARAPTARAPTPIAATDAVTLVAPSSHAAGPAQATLMDVEDAERRLDAVRESGLSFSPALHLVDGSLVGARGVCVRVRVITDGAVHALAARTLLHATPLYDAEVFPAAVTVYVFTRGDSDALFVDVQPGEGVCVCVCVSDRSRTPDVAALTTAIVSAAAALIHPTPGPSGAPAAPFRSHRSVRGGSHVPSLAHTRTHTHTHTAGAGDAAAQSVLSWYLRDGHVYADDAQPDKEPILLAGDVFRTGSATDSPLVFMAAHAPTHAGGVSLDTVAKAAAAGSLFAAHHVALCDGGLVAPVWAGALVPASSAGKAEGKVEAHGEPRPGVLRTQGVDVVRVAEQRASPAPKVWYVVDGGAPARLTGPDAAARLARAAGVRPDLTALLAARLGDSTVVAVPSVADSWKAAGW